MAAVIYKCLSSFINFAWQNWMNWLNIFGESCEDFCFVLFHYFVQAEKDYISQNALLSPLWLSYSLKGTQHFIEINQHTSLPKVPLKPMKWTLHEVYTYIYVACCHVPGNTTKLTRCVLHASIVKLCYPEMSVVIYCKIQPLKEWSGFKTS